MMKAEIELAHTQFVTSSRLMTKFISTTIILVWLVTRISDRFYSHIL